MNKPVTMVAVVLCLWARTVTAAPMTPSPVKSVAPVVAGADAMTIPQMMSYQGKLTDTLGQPVQDGDYQLTFRLYTQPGGGSPVWTEGRAILVRNGLFSALLGAVTPINSVPDAGALYLGLQVAVDPELSPRLRIASAAYAYLTARAGNADLLQGKDTTGFVRTGQANSVTSAMIVDGTVATADIADTNVTMAKIAGAGAATGQVVKWTGSAWAPRNDSVGSGGGGTVRKVVQAAGVVCAPNPITDSGTVRFDSTWGDGRYIKNQNSAGQLANFRITGTGRASQFYGVASTAGQPAVYADAGTYADGVYGYANNSFVFGMHAINANSTGTGIGASGNNASLIRLVDGSGGAFNGKKCGVYGRSADTASGTCGGYFVNGKGDWVRVAYYNGSTHYKINGIGTVSTMMATREGRKNLFAPEMPEAYFEDCGEGQLANGHCRINLEKLFSDCITVNAEHPLKVFVQLEDDCKGVYVNKDATGFDVRELQGGTSNARFSWRVLTKWKGNENVRLPEAPEPEPTRTVETQAPVDGRSTMVTLPQPVDVKSATTTQPRSEPGLK